MNAGHTWALILAAGDGSRLRALTTKPCGTAVPKQFCSLHGGRSLLEDAVARANALTPTDTLCAVVAQQHREWWTEQLARLPAENVIVQPRNLGTAIGILYPLLHILARDSHARLVLLPADHYVREEFVLRQSLRIALRQLDAHPQSPVLLGLQPSEPDGELGYIVPGDPDASGSRSVSRFVEKPSAPLALEIIGQGGLWNTFIIAATARSLLNLFVERCPEIVMELQAGVAHERRDPASTAVLEAYGRLPQLDFSRDVLERNAGSLRVVGVPPCGWSDLGTPRRVADTLRQIRFEDRNNAPPIRAVAHVNLALQYARMERQPAARGDPLHLS
jgi:mannose-1-phosphate guanylyltransferase